MHLYLCPILPKTIPPRKMRNPTLTLLLAVLLVLLHSCSNRSTSTPSLIDELESMPIVGSLLIPDYGFYSVNFRNYPDSNPSLPIGVFDSGTGGLTVLEAILQSDSYNNTNHQYGSDSIPDFERENFIYLADQANMPYGLYSTEGKSDLLVEHIIKDAIFLMSDKYYPDEDAVQYATGKQPVKTIVIACNTATAYGGLYLKALTEEIFVNLKVLGVIDAGARGALEHFGKDEGGTIGVLATVGTVASEGYYNSISRLINELEYKGDIRIFSWGGHGIAEAVDEEPDFIDRNLSSPRSAYKGPSLTDSIFRIDTSLLSVYGFDFSGNRMLCDSKDPFGCTEMQINDAENYMRYHIVSLLELIRTRPGSPPLKTLILGCTHYPYLSAEIRKILSELYEIRKNGVYLYRECMAEEVILVDPSVNLAKELYQVLTSASLLNNQPADSVAHEFYISVPNIHNPTVKVDESRRFTYEYKYGRNAGDVQEYVKVVPFSRRNISDETLKRLQKYTPASFMAIVKFNARSKKAKEISIDYLISRK